MRPRRIFLGFLLLATFAWSADSAPISEQEADQQFYAGLRQRGLFSLTESALQQKLDDVSTTPTQRDYYRLELSRTYSAHASQRLGTEQVELWKLARETAQNATSQKESTRWSPELEVQATLVPIEQTRFELEQLRLTPHDEALREKVVAELHTHLRSLRDLEKDLNRESDSILSRFRNDPLAISPYQFRRVQKRMIYETALVLAEIAEFEYSLESDRSPPIRAAFDRLQRLVSDADDELLTWQGRLLNIRCHRLQGSVDDARTGLKRYQAQWPPELVESVLAETARVDLVAGEPEIALERIQQWREDHGYLSGELLLTHLEILGNVWRVAWDRQRKVLADETLKQIQFQAQAAQTTLGGIWAWRASVFAEQMQQSTQYGPEIAEKVRHAKSSYQRQEFPEAQQGYQEAAEIAADKDQLEVAAEMLFTAGSISLQIRDFEAASQIFREGTDRFPETQRAADCHLMWTWCLGKRYEQSPTRRNREAYTAALEEHLEMFANRPTVMDAHLMYGQFQETRLQVTKALEHYLTIPTSHSRATEADGAALRCYQTILQRLEEQQKSTDAWREEATQKLSARISNYPLSATDLTLRHCEVMLGLSQLLLGRPENQETSIDSLLNRVIEACSLQSDTSQDSQSWKKLTLAAYRLKIVALAQAGRIREAEALLTRVANAGTKPLLDLLDGLSEAARDASPQTQRGLGELQLQTSKALESRRSELTGEERELLDLSLARAYLLTSRSTKAYEVYESLVKSKPEATVIRREFAEALVKCGTMECFRKALKHWSFLESQSVKGSSEWFRYRIEVIRALIETGQTDEASRLLKLTQLLYPKLETEALQQTFDNFQKKINREK